MPPLTPYQKSLRLEREMTISLDGEPTKILVRGTRYNGSTAIDDPPEILNLEAYDLKGNAIDLDPDEIERATALLLDA